MESTLQLSCFLSYGVDNETRTHGLQSHNLAL